MSARRGIQERDGGSRREKKPAKAAYVPTTYDEVMEAAVEMEEKAERFGHGQKAQRYYEDCLGLYERAGRLQASFDAQYNSARVLYQLSTSFHVPPSAMLELRTAIARYRACLPSAPDDIAREDATYNLAQALLDLADMGDAFGADPQEGAVARAEAVQLLQTCLAYEEESLRAAQSSEPEETTGAQDEDAMDTEDEGSAMEQHVPTAGSCLDTALLLVDACTDVWAGANKWPDVQEQDVVRDILARAGRLELDATQRIALQLAEMEVDVLLDQLAFEADGDATGSAARLRTILARPLEVPAEDPSDDAIRIRVDLQTAQADVHAVLATRALQLAQDASTLPTVWSHLSQGVTLLNKAVEMPIPPLAMPLAKSSLLNDVSQLSLRRAALAPLGHPPAQKAEAQLLANAEVYVNRSLAEGGWGYLCTQAVRTGALGATAVAVPNGAGYIKEELLEKAVLTLCRALGCQVASAASADKAPADLKLTEVLRKVKDMGRTRGRQLDSARVTKYVEEVEREQGSLAAWETTFWHNLAGQLAANR